MGPMLREEAYHMGTGITGLRRIAQAGVIPVEIQQKYYNKWISGSLDLFVEENLEYSRRLMLAGVPVELHVYPGAIHGFQLVSASRVAVRADRDKLTALRRALFGE